MAPVETPPTSWRIFRTTASGGMDDARPRVGALAVSWVVAGPAAAAGAAQPRLGRAGRGHRVRHLAQHPCSNSASVSASRAASCLRCWAWRCRLLGEGLLGPHGCAAVRAAPWSLAPFTLRSPVSSAFWHLSPAVRIGQPQAGAGGRLPGATSSPGAGGVFEPNTRKKGGQNRIVV